MLTKISTVRRRFVLEFFKLHREIPGVLILFAIINFFYLAIAAPTSDQLELQRFMSFTLGVLMPLPLALAGNFIVLKEFETNTIDLVRTRQSLEKIWIYRFVGFAVIALAGTVTLVLISNTIFGEILPGLMAFTIFAPTLLLSGFMAVLSGLGKNAYVGAGAGVVIWLYCLANSEILTTRLSINEVNYYPFLEWVIYKNRPYLLSSLIPNRLAISALSVVLLVLAYFLYKHNLRYLNNSMG